MLLEIIGFRKELGLEGLPVEAVRALSDTSKREWPNHPAPFENRLAEKNKSYGLYLEQVLKHSFGERYTFFVREVNPDPTKPSLTLDYETRASTIFDSVHNQSNIRGFLPTLVHEGDGHGSDPFLAEIGGLKIPLDVFVRMDHGRWKALSQALSIPGEFLNHPEDAMYPNLKRNVGRAVAEALVLKKDQTGLVDAGSKEELDKIIAEIAREQKAAPDEVKFNKRACYKIGDGLLNLRRQNMVKFQPELQQRYQDAMDYQTLHEIYAEMVKYAILYPDQINYDQSIISGITEIFSAIQGRPVMLKELKLHIENPDQEITRRFEAEEQALSQSVPAAGSSPVPTLTPEELARINKEEQERLHRQDLYDKFWTNGIWPEEPPFSQVPADQNEVLKAFMRRRHVVFSSHPGSAEMFTLNTSFDPQLDIWDIETIHAAMDPSITFVLWQDISQLGANLNRLKESTEILKNFIESPAF